MSDPIKDGGPAFACACASDGVSHIEDGMTLRDWFAGQALAGMAAYAGMQDPTDSIAHLAYVMADAMIAQREVAT
jgi:hypothetical protein